MSKDFLGKEIGGRYLISAKLGSGGMGSVFLAKDQKQGGKEVALKLIRQELCTDAKMRRRFVKESMVFAYLNHPHIVQVEQLSQTTDEQLYMVMEYIHSTSLQALRGLCLPFSLIVDLCTQLLEALAHSHIRGIIHRDLKPANILLTPLSNGTIFLKLVDFGIASLPSFAKGGDDFTRTVLGTPYYMAPEQSRGKASQIGPGTDIYSVGVILFELLSGRLPFVGEVDIETILMHIEEPIPDLSIRSETHAPREVEAIVRKCMAKKTWDRYVGAGELSKALSQLEYQKDESYKHITNEIVRIIKQEEEGRAAGIDKAGQASKGFLSQQISLGAPKSVELPSRDLSVQMLGSQVRQPQSEPATTPPSFPSAPDDLPSAPFASDSHPSLKTTLSENQKLYGREIEVGNIQEFALNALESRACCIKVDAAWGLGKSRLAREAVKKYVESNLMRYIVTMYRSNDTKSRLPQMFESILDSKNVETKSLPEYLLFRFKKLRFSQSTDAAVCVDFIRQSPENPKPDASIYVILIELLYAASAEMPLILHMEDIHAAPAFDLGFIDAFTGACYSKSMRCLLVCSVNSLECFPNTSASETLKSLTRYEGGRLKTLRLGPLPDTLMQKLFSQTYRFDNILSEIFCKFSLGNPLVARESVYTIIEERGIVSDSNGIYSLQDNENFALNASPLLKEIYLSYYGRLKQYISANSKLSNVEDIVVRLAILGDVVEDELLEAFFEKEAKGELQAQLDEVIEILIKLNFLSETTSAQGKTALAFQNPLLAKTILNDYSLRRLRPLHKLAISVKLEHYHSMDMDSCISMISHYEALGAKEESLLMTYKVFTKAAQEDITEQTFIYGMNLYHTFNEKFLSINAHDTDITYESFIEPINWPDVLEQLGRTIFFLGKIYEAEQIVDKLSYCAQRYNAPILIARALSLSALYLIRNDDCKAALKQIKESNLIASENEAGLSIVVNNHITRLLALLMQGLLLDYREGLDELQALAKMLGDHPDDKARKASTFLLALLAVFETLDEMFTFQIRENANHLISVRNMLKLHKRRFALGLIEKTHLIYSFWTNQQTLADYSFEDFKRTISTYTSTLFAGYPEILSAFFFLSRDMFTEAIEFTNLAEDLFQKSNEQIGLSLTVYLRALVALRQLDHKLCLAYISKATKLAMHKSYWVLAGSLLLATKCAFNQDDKKRGILYFGLATKLFQRSCDNFLFFESATILIHLFSHGCDEDFFLLLDKFFQNPSAQYNFFYSISAVAIVAAALKKDLPRLLNYYTQFVKTKMGAYDYYLLERCFPGGLNNVVTFIDSTQSSDIALVAMRAGIIKLLEREAIFSPPTESPSALNFDELDSSLDEIAKMLAD